MGLLDIIKSDIESITSNLNEFGVSITLTSTNNVSTILTGIHTKHHLGIDTDGNMVNSKKASIAFSEKFLSCRNSNEEISLTNYRVNVKDSTGVTKKYIVQQWFPDETIGLIVCILEDYDNN